MVRFTACLVATTVVAQLERCAEPSERAVYRSGAILDASFDTSGDFLCVGGRKEGHRDKSVLRLYDARSGQLLAESAVDQRMNILAFSPSLERLAWSEYDSNRINIVELDIAKRTFSHSDAPIVSAGRTASLAMSPDGRHLVQGCHDGKALVWDIEARRQVHTFEHGTVPISCIAYSPGGDKLAIGSAAGSVLIWDSKNFSKLLELTGPPGLSRITWSTDGALLGAAADGWSDPRSGELARAVTSAMVWRMPSGELLRTFKGDVVLNAVAFHPTEPLAVIPDGKQIQKVWSVTQDKVRDVEFEHSGRPLFCPSGDKLTIISIHGLGVWNMTDMSAPNLVWEKVWK